MEDGSQGVKNEGLIFLLFMVSVTPENPKLKNESIKLFKPKSKPIVQKGLPYRIVHPDTDFPPLMCIRDCMYEIDDPPYFQKRIYGICFQSSHYYIEHATLGSEGAVFCDSMGECDETCEPSLLIRPYDDWVFEDRWILSKPPGFGLAGGNIHQSFSPSYLDSFTVT